MCLPIVLISTHLSRLFLAFFSFFYCYLSQVRVASELFFFTTQMSNNKKRKQSDLSADNYNVENTRKKLKVRGQVQNILRVSIFIDN